MKKSCTYLLGLMIVVLLAIVGSAKSQTVHGLPKGFSGTGSNINVLYNRMYWELNPDTIIPFIKGSVQFKFVTTQTNVAQISFDLNDVLQIDSVTYAATKLSFTRANNIVQIQLPQPLLAQVYDSFTVYYQGNPPSSSLTNSGFSNVMNQVSKQRYITTLSESYEDRDWWPCKADMQDKIDSFDIYVKVPWQGADTFWVASNGRLIDSAIQGNSRLFHFTSTYPIASYLIAVNVCRYNRYYRTMNLQGKPLQVVYNIIRGKTKTVEQNIVKAMDVQLQVMDSFCKYLGMYPFVQDKHGYYEGLVGASGMEHQTFSAIAVSSTTDFYTLAHELMHQWFGDKVTFGTWNDLWLAEGFASFGEAFAAEKVKQPNVSAAAKQAQFKQLAINNASVSAWIPNANIVNSNTIWQTAYSSAAYNRGEMVVSMLRAMLGDSLFFTCLKQYVNQPTLAYQSASTDSLIQIINAFLPVPMNAFFNDFVFANGYPIYNLQYHNMGNGKVGISVLSQTASSGSTVNYYRTPLVIRMQGAKAGQDTTVVIMDWGNGNLSYAGKGIMPANAGNFLTYQLSFNPTTFSFDPGSQILAQANITLSQTNIQLSIKQQQGQLTASVWQQPYTPQANLVLQAGSSPNNVKTIAKFIDKGNGYYEIPKMDMLRYDAYFRAVQYDDKTGQEKMSNIIHLPCTQAGFALMPILSRQMPLVIKNFVEKPTTMCVYNSVGKLCYSLQANQPQVQIPAHVFTSGVYIIAQYSGQQLLQSQQLVWP